MNLAGCTMEKFRSADDFSAKSCTNGLVAEANTEDGKFSGKTGDELDGNARFPRRARSGRNDNALRAAAGDFFHADFVAAMDFDARAQPAQILREGRSEEPTSELPSPLHIVCRLLLEKKKKSTAPAG